MQYDKIAKSYKAQSVQTASPGKLVLMLFDGYLRFTTAAVKSFEETDLTKKNEGINNNLIKAQNIVTELQSSLDMSVPGELPGTLYRLYDYVLHQLQQANLQKNPEPIAEADKVIAIQATITYVPLNITEKLRFNFDENSLLRLS